MSSLNGNFGLGGFKDTVASISPYEGMYYAGKLNGSDYSFTDDNLHLADAGTINFATDGNGLIWGGSSDIGKWFTNDGGFQSNVTGADVTSGLMDWANKYSKGIGSLAGLAGLGMNAYSTFFGQGKEAFDKNMQLMDQQIASNKEKMARRDALNKAWASTEANKNAGLAASGIA